jgi:hypothetical protein
VTAILRCVQRGLGGYKMQLERLGASASGIAYQLEAVRGR